MLAIKAPVTWSLLELAADALAWAEDDDAVALGPAGAKALDEAACDDEDEPPDPLALAKRAPSC